MSGSAKPQLSERQRKALVALAARYHPEEPRYYYFRTIAKDADLPLCEVRRTVRALARKGLAEYGKGLWTEDGELAGAGYCCTAAGAALVASL